MGRINYVAIEEFMTMTALILEFQLNLNNNYNKTPQFNASKKALLQNLLDHIQAQDSTESRVVLCIVGIEKG